MFFGTCASAPGCHAQLPRLAAQGRHDEVAARAGKARILPRGRAARAWAASLVALGRADEARAVLLRDFRTHAELASLVALADLEAGEGRVGLAAAHYARAASLEVDPLAGRRDVCELFRRRAARFLAEGEALAADLDLRRVAMICPRGKTSEDEVTWRSDRALHERVIAAAKVQARAQRTLRGCEGGRCRPAAADARVQALAQELAHARAAGPAALRAAAARLRTQLDVNDVAGLLAAELRGELGIDLVDLDELRGWIGDGTAADVVTAADGRVAAIERDYVRLRLSQLGPGFELPGDDAARSTASAVIRLLEAADADPAAAAMSWRVFVLLGDLPSAEMALAASLGGRPGPGAMDRSGGTGPTTPGAGAEMSRGTGGAAEPAQRRVPAPGLWSARGEVDAATLPRLLLLARLRGAAGRRDQALAIAAWALAEAQARGLPAIPELAASEARRELAAGRPWAALALAATVPGAPTADVARAAGSALVLERASCGERCGDADDRAAVRQVFGETWLIDQESRAVEGAFARAAAAPRGAACPLLAEVLAPDAGGALAAALRRARTEGLGAPGLPDELRRAIESDLTLDCAGRIAVPLMYAADARVAATALADSLAHAPQEAAAGQLAVQSELALFLGRRDQADQLALAAAATSAEPREVWRRAAATAAHLDARHHELLALRQLLLHGVEGAEADEIRLRLAVRGLRDADDAWAPRNAEAGREALIRGVASYVDAVPPARRWHAREALAFALADYTWADDAAASLVRAAVWPDDAVARAHPAGHRRLERALGGAASGSPPALAPLELAAALAPPAALTRGPTAVSEDMAKKQGSGGGQGEAGGGGALLPVEAETFCVVDALEPARLAALRSEAPGEPRRRAAVALAVTGGPKARKQALQVLLAELPPERRAAALDAVIAGLSAASGSGAAPVLASDDDLLAVVFGLVRDPRRRPREIKGQEGSGR